MTAKKVVISKKRCIVCGHVDRARIEAAKIAGAGLDTIAAKFKVSRDAVWRHCKAHISEDMRAEYLAAVPMQPAPPVPEMKAITDVSKTIEHVA
jgi:cytochrome c551/c552